jgi:hypothetical protein
VNVGRVFMEFPGGTRLWIRSSDVAKAMKEDGAKYVERPKARGALDFAPMAGGIAGGIVGGVAGSALGPAGAIGGRMVGGVAGGVLGKLAQEGGYRAIGFPDAPGTVGEEAAFQAGAGAIGEVGSGVMRLLGRGAIRAGLPLKLSESGNVVKEMVRERVPIGGISFARGKLAPRVPVVGPSLVKGSQQAERVWAERTAAREAANAAAEAAGARIPRAAAEQALQRVIDTAKHEMADDAEVRYFQRVLNSWRRRKSPDLGIAEVQRIVTRFNNLNRPVHSALKAGKSVPEDALQQKMTQRMALADRLSEELAFAVPEWAAMSDALGKAIAMKNAVNLAEHQAVRTLGSRLATGSAFGTGLEALSGERDPREYARSGLIGAGAGAALTSPALLSRFGLFLNDPLLQLIAQQSPRAMPAPHRE